MKPIVAIAMLLFVPASMWAQAATTSVLILLRQPEGTLGKRLAEMPASTPVPEEVRAVAKREQASMVQAQQDSFEQRIMAAGATGVVQYPDLNMMRAEVPQSALSALQSDPAVVSVNPLSEDAQAGAKVAPLPAANLGVGVPPSAGVAAGVTGRRSEALQSPSLPIGGAMPMPGVMGMPLMQGMSMPGMSMPGQMPGMSGAMLPGMPQMPNMPMMSGGGMLPSILGVTGQMGLQAETAMPRSAGAILLLSAGAQLAQVVLANRKPSCAITLATVGTQLPEAGGQGVIAVDAPPSCLWRAQSDADWLKIDNAGPVIGPGIVKYTAAAASAGMLRTGVISMVGVAKSKVKGKTSVTVRQGQ